MVVELRFDASLSEDDAGANFVVTCRDQKHARQVAAWLRDKVQDKSRTFVTASLQLPPQTVAIDVPDELSN